MAEVEGAKINSDTVFMTKEVIVPKIEFDTVLTYRNFRDTITVVKNGIVTHVKIDTVKKTLYVAVDCPPDTLKIKVPVKVTQTIENGFPWGWLVLAFCGGLALGLFATHKR